MKVRLTKDCDTQIGKKPKTRAGTIIDHPDAEWLIRLGVAEAVDGPGKVEKGAEAPDGT